MPRLPVDGKKVIEHRISFGTKERQLIESFANANTFNKVATPTVDLMKDVSGMVVFVAAFAALTGIVIDLSNVTNSDELVDKVKEAYSSWRQKKNSEYIEARIEAGDPIEPGLLNYDPTEEGNQPGFWDELRFIAGSIKELWGAGGFPGGY